LLQIGARQIARFVMILKHLHWHSVCDHALEILDEVQQSNQMDSLEDCCDPEKNAQPSETWRSSATV
jgi:hypothetical protein